MRLRARSGFTLAELMVAVLLIDVGLLALVAGSAVVVRTQNEIRLRFDAARAAANRVQWLAAAGGCTATIGTSSTQPGIVESWSAAPVANGFRELSDSVVFTSARVEHRVVLRTRLPC